MALALAFGQFFHAACIVSTQVKLLNVYIKRALEQRGQGGYTVSETSSPTSAVDNL